MALTQGTRPLADVLADNILETLRARIGAPKRVAQWSEAATQDNIRHWAMGIGDDNPLWWDESYAKTSPLGGITAPPTYLYCHANGPFFARDEQTDDPLDSYAAFTIAERWVWSRSVRLDEAISAEAQTIAAGLQKWGEPPHDYATEVVRTAFRASTGEIVAENFSTLARCAREELAERANHLDRPLKRYDEAERRRIEAHYRAEAAQRRGGLPRYCDDCAVGERLPVQLKGPLSLNNLIGYLMGQGVAWNATNRMAYALHRAAPSMRAVNPDSGAADTWASAHWEPALARQNGLPAGYDYAAQRCSWMAQVVTDWMGDFGRFDELDVRFLRPNLMSDLTSVDGRVIGKAGPEGRVEIQLQARNQLDEVTAEGLARITLPKR